MADFTLKRNDTRPELFLVLKNSAGAAVDLTTAQSVAFHMAASTGGAVKVNAAMTVTNAVGGTVKYTWIGTDTDTAGSFNGEAEVTWSAGVIQTFPNKGYVSIEIDADIV